MGRRLLQVTVEFLVDATKAGPARAVNVVRNPLPDDAVCVGVMDGGDGTVCLVIESATYPETSRLELLDPPLFEVVREGGQV